MKMFFRFVPFYLLVMGLVLGSALWGDRVITAMSEMAPIEGRTRIVIDAGHGEPDGGAVSCTGVHESVINLQIAKRLDDLLHFLGYETVMIRNNADSVYTEGDTIGQKKVSDLKERVRIVNGTANAILLSIHQNHYTDSKYSGAQMFYARSEGSRELAEVLQTAFVSHLNPGSNRKAKKSEGIYLMEHADCTAVLVECGFLSNPAEEVKLRNETYQKWICCTIASGLSTYLNT